MAARGHSPRTVEHRLRCLGYFLRWAGPRLPPAQRLRPAILEEYTRELARQPARRGGLLAASTRSTRVYALRAFVRWLHGSRHHARDLRFALVPPRLPRPLPRAVMNAGEVERVLAATRPGRSFGSATAPSWSCSTPPASAAGSWRSWRSATWTGSDAP
jgi:site-specific recombinase XerD